MDTISTIALTMGTAWASGINLYATVFVLGYLNLTGDIALPPDMQYLSDPLVLGAAAFMYLVEFFADKTPGVDTGWDALHTFIRIPAGAVLAAQAMGDISPAAQLAAALIGGGLAATTHATKAGSRVLINTSPEPVSNWAASLSEDVLAIAGIWAAMHYPWLFLAALIVFMLIVIWVLPKLWRAIRRVLSSLGRLFGGGGAGSRANLPPPSSSNLDSSHNDTRPPRLP